MNDDQVSIEVPTAHFTLFNTTYEDLPEVIVVNDALLGFRYTELFEWSLRVRIEAGELAAQGMPTPGESEILRGIDEEIESTVLSTATALGSTNSLFLARSTWNGLRELYFLVHDPEAAHQALQNLLSTRVWARHWEYTMEHDPGWDHAAHIFRLFPLAKGLDG